MTVDDEALFLQATAEIATVPCQLIHALLACSTDQTRDVKSHQITDSLEIKKGKSSPYSITERRVLELIPVLGSQPAGDVSNKPSRRLPLLSTRPAVTTATLKRAAIINFAAW